MLTYLKGASPWLRLVGIVGFIGSGITVLSGVLFLALIPVMNTVWESIPEIGSYAELFGAVFSGAVGIYCIIFGVLFFLPCLYAYNFGSKIRSYLKGGADQDLEAAFKNNKSLWKFIGIITIISLAFIPVMLIIGVLVGIAMALG
jgi:hypothetical protein